MASAPLGQETEGVVASAVFRTKLRRLLTYKGIQPAKNGAIWSEKYSPGTFGSCATAVREEEEEDKTWECRGRYLHVGAPPLGSKVSYVHCSVPASSWQASFAGFRSCSGVARLFVCITAYKQPLPYLHRQHYRAVWL